MTLRHQIETLECYRGRRRGTGFPSAGLRHRALHRYRGGFNNACPSPPADRLESSLTQQGERRLGGFLPTQHFDEREGGEGEREGGEGRMNEFQTIGVVWQ